MFCPWFLLSVRDESDELHGVLLIVISSLLLIHIIFDRYAYT
jgi:hypothetical protein